MRKQFLSYVVIPISLVLVFALIIRFLGLNWGLPYIYRGCENVCLHAAIRILFTGDLNPHCFVWPGSFITYVFSVLFGMILAPYFIYCFSIGHIQNLGDFEQLVKINPIFYFYINPVLFCFIGRLLMVMFSVITVYLVYLVAKNLFNKPVGIISAFCLSISPLHVHHSRLIRPDIPATMLIMFSIYFLMRNLDEHKSGKLLVLSSLFAGFSIAAKYPAGIIVFPILIHCLVGDSARKNLVSNLSKAVLFIFLGFFIFAPFVILDFESSSKAIIHEFTKRPLIQERLPGIQNFIWYLQGPLRTGIGGLFFEMFSGLGLWLILSRKSYKTRLFCIFPVLFFLLLGAAPRRCDRYAVPILPFEAILFGFGFHRAYEYFIQKKVAGSFKPGIFALFTAMMVFGSFPVIMSDIKEKIKLCREDTRTMAKDWIEKNLPSGSKIAYSAHAVHLHINPKGNFDLMYNRWKHFVSRPISYYQNRSVDYVVIRTEAPEEISRYEELRNKYELVKRFENEENPGPGIEIYRLKSRNP